MLASLVSSASAAAILLATASTSSAALDSTLHRSFYGMAYSPDGAILPNCGSTQTQVNEDIILLAQLTPRIRLYGSDCNQTALVLQAIRDTNADITVWPGVYLDGNQTVYERQMDALVDAIKTYGTKNLGGLTIGNEYLLQSYGDTGTATDAKGVAARTKLLDFIQQTNTTIKAMNLDKHIPIGTADAGSAVTTQLCTGADYVMANVHPWFGSVNVAGAAAWTSNFFKEFDTDICAQASNNPVMYVAETGWPTSSDDTANAVNGASSPASVAGLQTFLDTYPCQATANSTNYFFFEFKDEPWKAIYGGVEQHWGLFTTDRKLKTGLTIPNCPVDSPLGGTVDQIKFSSGSSNSSSGGSSTSSGSTSSGSNSSGSNSSGSNSSGSTSTASGASSGGNSVASVSIRFAGASTLLGALACGAYTFL